MKVIHRPEIDYLSIDFKDEVETKSYLRDGIIVREDKKGNIIGIDIIKSSELFLSDDTVSLQQACVMMGISESTLRRKIKDGKIKYTRPNGKDYRFKKSDILKLVS